MRAPKDFAFYVLNELEDEPVVIKYAMIWDHPYPQPDWPEMLSSEWRTRVSTILNEWKLTHRWSPPSHESDSSDDWSFVMERKS